MRNQLKIVYSALTIVATLGLTSTVHGIPAFARQTGLDCNSCHASVGYPALNSFGAAFRAGGYTQASEDSLMGDGEALSLPKTLNLAVVAKMRANFFSHTMVGAYEKTTTAADGKKGQVASPDGTGIVDKTKTTSVGSNRVDMPDEWAIWLAGRAGKHIGFATEYNKEGPVSFKMPIVYDIGPLKAGFVPYWTDAQGPGWGFETLSTGAVGNVKIFENGPAQSARMYLEDKKIGIDSGKALGAGVYIWHPMGFVYYSPFLVSGQAKDVFNAQFAHNLRVAFTPSFGGIDLAIGFQTMFGNTATGSEPDRDTTKLGVLDAKPRSALARIDYLGFDAQVAGTIGIPMMIVGTFGMADATKTPDGTNKAGAAVNAWTVLLNATVVEDLLNVGVGFRGASWTYYQVKSTDAAGVNTMERAKYTPEQFGTAGAAGTAVEIPVVSDNQLIAEVKFNLSRNMRLSLTGYLPIGAMDTVSADGKTLVATQQATVAAVQGGDINTAKQESRLLVMLFGAF